MKSGILSRNTNSKDSYEELTRPVMRLQHILHIITSLRNECTGVQNPHRYMHAYNIAGDVSHGSLCILFNVRSIELHTLHAPEQGCGTTKLVHTLHLNRVLELAVFLRVSDLRVGGRHLALPLYKLKPSVTYFN